MCLINKLLHLIASLLHLIVSLFELSNSLCIPARFFLTL